MSSNKNPIALAGAKPGSENISRANSTKIQAGEYDSIADLVSANLAGSLAASKVLDEIRLGIASPDAASIALIDLLKIENATKRAITKGFARALQKTIERGADVR